MSVALVIWQAERVRRIVLPAGACLVPPYFSTLPRKLHDFREKLLNVKCVF